MALYRLGTVTDVDRVLQRPDDRQGATFTFRATARTAEADEVVAVKTVTGRRLVNEIAAAWVAGKLSLEMVPSIWLVDDPGGLLQRIAGGSLSGGVDGRWLASTFSDLPAYEPPVDLCGLRGLAGNPAFRRMMVFDVLVANGDRVNRNILQRGDDVCAFDHDKAFHGENWDACALDRLVSTTPFGLFENCLVHADTDDRDLMLSVATDWAGTIGAADIDDLDALVTLAVVETNDIRALKRFIIERSTNLAALVEDVLNRNASA